MVLRDGLLWGGIVFDSAIDFVFGDFVDWCWLSREVATFDLVIHYVFGIELSVNSFVGEVVIVDIVCIGGIVMLESYLLMVSQIRASGAFGGRA
jgi:hypothetical protein